MSDQRDQRDPEQRLPELPACDAERAEARRRRQTRDERLNDALVAAARKQKEIDEGIKERLAQQLEAAGEIELVSTVGVVVNGEPAAMIINIAAGPKLIERGVAFARAQGLDDDERDAKIMAMLQQTVTILHHPERVN